ncbi:MAG: hypothetical protein E7546_07455 [Ruminococcaceae bacterium]|nr:hypothetical protein [Oscillospiraceae bacterium]
MRKQFTKITAVICLLALVLSLFAGCTAPEAQTEPQTAPVSDYTGGYITDKRTEIETEHVILKVDSNVYVPVYVPEYIEEIYAAVEEASGLTFEGGKFGKKVTILVEKDTTHATESEVSTAYAYTDGSCTICISSGDLLLGNSYAMVHELSHALNYAHTRRYSCDTLSEGFAEYVCFRAIELLEKESPEVAFSIDTSLSCILNMDISEPEAVYTQSMEYWLENNFPFEYAGNGHYTLGFRFMAYLDDVYGNCSAWIPLCNETADGTHLKTDTVISILKEAYDDEVLDGFYPWLYKNESKFSPTAVLFDTMTDLSLVDEIAIYPFFMAHDCNTALSDHNIPVIYKDLCINVEETKQYLRDYKDRDISALSMHIDWYNGDKEVDLLDADKKVIKTVSGKEDIPLDGVSYVVIKGDGVIGSLRVVGYLDYEGNMKQ